MSNVKPLLDFIAAHESEGAARRLGISAYDVVWGKIRASDRPRKPLTSMTIGEVLAWQDSIDKQYQSEAAGRYQIMEDTLRGLWAAAGMRLTDRFDAAGQDRLATELLNRRGLARYLAGALSTEDFANSLAKEWASLPVVSGPKKGSSYYAGDGLNRAGVDVEPFLAAVRAVRDAAKAPTAPPAVDVPRRGIWADLIAALLRLFKGLRDETR